MATNHPTSDTRYELLAPSYYDRHSDTYQTRSGSWQAIGGYENEFDTIEEARAAIREMQATGWGTLAIREIGERYPEEIYKLTCPYCGHAMLDSLDTIDDQDDDWRDLASEHEPDCEWLIQLA